MPTLTAQSLLRELGSRLGDYWPLTPTSAGSTTTLVDANLPTILPTSQGSATAALGAWVYGTSTADASNVGITRRAQSYNSLNTTLTFLTAWPAAPTTGTYELHRRFARDRKLAALNAAVHQLGCYWARLLKDASITTVVNTWRYQLPSTINWDAVDRILLQVNTTAGFSTYPYVDIETWNCHVESETDTSGNTLWYLQFGIQPPPGRLLQVWAQAQFDELALDTDVLPLSEQDAGQATEWVYSFACWQLFRWEAILQPQNQTEWLEKQGQALLTEAADLRDRLSRARPTLRLILPGRGTGEFPAGIADDPAYLAAFGSPH